MHWPQIKRQCTHSTRLCSTLYFKYSNSKECVFDWHPQIEAALALDLSDLEKFILQVILDLWAFLSLIYMFWPKLFASSDTENCSRTLTHGPHCQCMMAVLLNCLDSCVCVCPHRQCGCCNKLLEDKKQALLSKVEKTHWNAKEAGKEKLQQKNPGN